MYHLSPTWAKNFGFGFGVVEDFYNNFFRRSATISIIFGLDNFSRGLQSSLEIVKCIGVRCWSMIRYCDREWIPKKHFQASKKFAVFVRICEWRRRPYLANYSTYSSSRYLHRRIDNQRENSVYRSKDQEQSWDSSRATKLWSIKEHLANQRICLFVRSR